MQASHHSALFDAIIQFDKQQAISLIRHGLHTDVNEVGYPWSPDVHTGARVSCTPLGLALYMLQYDVAEGYLSTRLFHFFGVWCFQGLTLYTADGPGLEPPGSFMDFINIRLKSGKTVEPPTLVQPGGTYFQNVAIKLQRYACGLDIRYTADGSEPTRKSPRYVRPVVITQPGRTVFQAIATCGKTCISSVVRAEYFIIDEIDGVDDQGTPILHALIQRKDVAGVQQLVRLGADLTQKDRTCQSAMDLVFCIFDYDPRRTVVSEVLDIAGPQRDAKIMLFCWINDPHFTQRSVEYSTTTLSESKSTPVDQAEGDPCKDESTGASIMNTALFPTITPDNLAPPSRSVPLRVPT